MQAFVFSRTAVCLATAVLLASCGGGGSDGGSSGSAPVNPSDVSTAAVELPLVLSEDPSKSLTIGSTFAFLAGKSPSVRVVEIKDNNLVDPPLTTTSYRLGEAITKTSDGLPIEPGKKRYLVTMTAGSDKMYRSPTRGAANENCADNPQISGRLCPPEAGRDEALGVTFRAITDFTTPTNVGPLSSLVTERVRFLLLPSNNPSTSPAMTVASAQNIAELDLSRLLLNSRTITSSGTATTVRPVASIPVTSGLLNDALGSVASVAQGALERLVQQMFRRAGERSSATGYSSMYDRLFASFARDGRFETSFEDVQGNSVGLRSVGALLNSALTEHLLKDAPRFATEAVANFRLGDFFASPAAMQVRGSLANTYRDLYDAPSGAVTSIAYVSKNANGNPRDHIITAVAARNGGVFFLDSRGEAQDGSKPVVRCETSKFGFEKFEVTGVAALEGAAAPLILAYNHTDTKAVLIDVRQVGLDAATSSAELPCTLTPTAYRIIDFREVSQNASLYQNAPQYQHQIDGEELKPSDSRTTRPVTLTGAVFNALENQIKITTLDGTLSFSLVPSAATDRLPFQTRYSSFTPYVDKGQPGQGLNPAFDNTFAGIDGVSPKTALWSVFDYNTKSDNYNQNLRGIYQFNFSSATPAGTLNALPDNSRAIQLTGKIFSQTSSLARAFSPAGNSTGVALVGDIDSSAYALLAGEAQEDYKVRVNCLDPSVSKKRDASTLGIFGGASVYEFSTVKRITDFPRLSPRPLLVPKCQSGSLVVRNGRFSCLTTTTSNNTGLFGTGLFGGDSTTTDNFADPSYDFGTSTREIKTTADLDATYSDPVKAEELFGRCTVGYHGVAMENRYIAPTGAIRSAIDAIGVASKAPQIKLGSNVMDAVDVRGLVKTARIPLSFGSGTGISAAKDFRVLSAAPDETRQLVLDDIRSYGVLRLRGTFAKPLAYFLAKEVVGNPATIKYSLIEVDLDTVRTVQDAVNESSAYNIPKTAAESRTNAGPVRVYFR